VSSQRFVPLLLLALLLSLHAQLWLGRGSVSHVNALQARLHTLQEQNKAASLANEQLAAEVRDLKEGLEMVETIARSELGMVKPNEILVQYAK
jgi:cell division protein FtsB